jgi:hypothetical protein
LPTIRHILRARSTSPAGHRKYTSRIASAIPYDQPEVATSPSHERSRMSIDTALNILQVVATIGLLMAAFQIRDRLDKLNQQIEKK